MAQDSSPPPIRVRLAQGRPGQDAADFTASFTIGRAPDCDVVLENKLVSGQHAAVEWDQGAWWLRDLNSRNGTFLDGRQITRAQLPSTCSITLARNGPEIHLEIVRSVAPDLERTRLDAVTPTSIEEHYFGQKEPPPGERTRLIQRAFHKVQKKEKKHYRTIIAIIGVILALTAAALWYQSRRVERLEQLHAVAANMFYSMKSLELQLAKLRLAVGETADQQLKVQLEEKAQEQRELQQDYDDLIRDELGISQEDMPEEDWLIYKVARLFGECDVVMPDDFKDKVKEYIARWRSTGRMQRALAVALRNGFSSRIVAALREQNMPAQFFYLALQESNFNTRVCGPPTRFGIAKGMWQFIPMTATKYGLQLGPNTASAEFDPEDDRHDFDKSTRAAAMYIRDLYQTEAQGSGLLVMACYNWGEEKVLDRVLQMPENPRDRNFWNLIKEYQIPQETYDYVFYIIAATVIGENPRLFGFDFDSPLSDGSLMEAGTMPDTAAAPATRPAPAVSVAETSDTSAPQLAAPPEADTLVGRP